MALCCVAKMYFKFFFQDYQTVGRVPPQLDDQQDWMLSYSSENNGVTKLKFYRKLITNDQNDVIIQVNSGSRLTSNIAGCYFVSFAGRN